ncbi:hypothetical protein RXV95_09860 [Novosphingobium sp. ZN18A2]|uniref:hypothetical protein n=1 Tax=Novosphingobium sp. ZN18A2 TaxID=3079861 RepID=UPI0030CE7378
MISRPLRGANAKVPVRSGGTFRSFRWPTGGGVRVSAVRTIRGDWRVPAAFQRAWACPAHAIWNGKRLIITASTSVARRKRYCFLSLAVAGQVQIAVAAGFPRLSLPGFP